MAPVMTATMAILRSIAAETGRSKLVGTEPVEEDCEQVGGEH